MGYLENLSSWHHSRERVYPECEKSMSILIPAYLEAALRNVEATNQSISVAHRRPKEDHLEDWP